MDFNPQELTTRQVYRLMASTIVPRPIAWVTTLDSDGVRNAAPFSFFNVLASEPPLLGFSPSKTRPKYGAKDTQANIEATGEFVINLVPWPLVQQMHQTSAGYPPSIDELSEVGLGTRPAQRVKPPLIEGCRVSFECELERIISFSANYNLVVGKVLVIHLWDQAWDEDSQRVKVEQLEPVGRFIGDGYFPPSKLVEVPKQNWE